MLCVEVAGIRLQNEVPLIKALKIMDNLGCGAAPPGPFGALTNRLEEDLAFF